MTELAFAVPADVLDLCTENYLAVLQGERRDFQFSSEGATFAIQAVPVHSEDGAIEAALVLARDVTEQERLTDGLLRSEERLRRAEGLVGGGSWEFSLDADTLMWSDGLARIHGVMPDGGSERLSAYVARVHPADRAHFERNSFVAWTRDVRRSSTASQARMAARRGR